MNLDRRPPPAAAALRSSPPSPGTGLAMANRRCSDPAFARALLRPAIHGRNACRWPRQLDAASWGPELSLHSIAVAPEHRALCFDEQVVALPLPLFTSLLLQLSINRLLSCSGLAAHGLVAGVERSNIACASQIAALRLYELFFAL